MLAIIAIFVEQTHTVTYSRDLLFTEACCVTYLIKYWYPYRKIFVNIVSNIDIAANIAIVSKLKTWYRSITIVDFIFYAVRFLFTLHVWAVQEINNNNNKLLGIMVNSNGYFKVSVKVRMKQQIVIFCVLNSYSMNFANWIPKKDHPTTDPVCHVF